MNRLCIWLLILMTGSSLFGQRKALLLEHPNRIRLTPVSALNSSFRETNLCITPDGQYLFFMSLRGGQKWSRSFMQYQGRDVFDGDIWYSKKKKGAWQAPKCLPYGVNTPSGEDEPNVSPDGNTVFYQSWNDLWELTQGPYYEVSYSQKSGKWGMRKGMGGGIHDFFISNEAMRATDGMSVSPDGRTFIVACGQGYDEPMDIYMSTKGRLGWGFLKRLSISTNGDERSVFLAADGRTLYFASDAYEGYGGLDIYKTIINEDGTMGEVINLGAPFNTPKDDYGFILSGDGTEGYFIRESSPGNGDIYYADLTDADPRIKPGIDINLYGTIQDSASGVGIQAEIVLLDAYTKRPVKRIKTDARGNYRTTIPNKAAAYDQIVVAKDYRQKQRRLRTKKTAYADNYEMNFFLGRTSPPPMAVVRPRPKPPTPKPDPVPDPEPESKKKKLGSIGGIDAQGSPVIGGDTEVGKVGKVDNPYDFTGVANNNLILLIDVSASMKQSSRLPLLKQAFLKLAPAMRKDDRVTILAYNDNVEVIAEGVPATQIDEISAAIDRLSAGGGTRGKSALRRAYRLAETYYIPGGNNRIILSTDGYFDLNALTKVANNYKNRIKLSVFSFGKLGPDRFALFDKIAKSGGGYHTNITRANIDEALLNEAKAVTN
ncbi:MAG: VWA domain-containing protein [Bacteroidia bacterium]